MISKAFLPKPIGSAAFLWSIIRERLVRPLLAAAALGGLGALLQAVAPLFLKGAVDHFAQSRMDAATVAVLFYVGAIGAARLAHAAFIPVYAGAARRLVHSVSSKVYGHTLDLPYAYHLARRTGELSRIIADGLFGCRTIFMAVVSILLPTAVEIFVAGGVLLHLFDAAMLAAYLAFVALYGLTFHFAIKAQKQAQTAAMKSDGAASNLFLDSLLNFENVKTFTAEPAVMTRLGALLDESERKWLGFFSLYARNSVALAIVLTLSFGGIFALALRRLGEGGGAQSDLLLIALYLMQAISPVERLTGMSRELLQGFVHVDHMLDILSEKTEAALFGGNAPLPGRGPVEIRVEGLSHAYSNGHFVLRDVSFEIPAGRSLAVVGASGGGKSTLARLLFRFLEPTRGAILVDGVAIETIGLEDLRRAFALAPQDCVLFNDTLRDNVLFARPEATRAEIAAAMRAAGLDEVIARLPQGEETVVGERGLRLSGGEKQRVAIARALLRRPRLLVFDEATSSLDTRTERLIQDRLAIATKGVTRLVIAHRLSTVIDADEIIVLEDGEIVERGDHARLVASGGVYARMWAAQRRDQESEALDDIRAG
jgi:ABC-type transport system involved in Fe-S cluster assembly fused permease/ATPase subunit